MSAGKTIGHSGLARDANVATLAHAINRALLGNINCTHPSFTLSTGSTSTTLTDPRIFATSFLSLMPTTSDAAAEIRSNNVYFSGLVKGSATVNHSSSTVSDRSFTVLIIG